MRVRALFILALCAALVCSAAACTRGSRAPARPRIGFVSNGIASFWVIAEAGARAAAEQFEVDLSVRMPDGIDAQKRMLEDLLMRGVDGVAISPIDPDHQTEMLDRAAAQTALITQDSDAPRSKRLAYIGMDNYAAGRLTGQLVKEALPQGGAVMIFIGRVEQDNARRRRQGVIDELLERPSDATRYDPPGAVLRGGRFTILGTLTDQFDRAKAKANCEDALTRHPDLAAMVGLFVYNPPLCLEALAQSGRAGQVQVIGFDEADETLQAVKDGRCYGTVVQNPFRYGFESVRMLSALARGDKTVLPPDGFLNIPARQIRKDNVEAFWSDLRRKLNPALEQ